MEAIYLISIVALLALGGGLYFVLRRDPEPQIDYEKVIRPKATVTEQNSEYRYINAEEFKEILGHLLVQFKINKQFSSVALLQVEGLEEAYAQHEEIGNSIYQTVEIILGEVLKNGELVTKPGRDTLLIAFEYLDKKVAADKVEQIQRKVAALSSGHLKEITLSAVVAQTTKEFTIEGIVDTLEQTLKDKARGKSYVVKV